MDQITPQLPQISMICPPNRVFYVANPSCLEALGESPLPDTTHNIEMGNTEFRYVASGNGSVYYAHHAGPEDSPFSDPVDKITITQLGSAEAPYLKRFETTCEKVNLNGYIHRSETVFQVVSQLPNVTKVKIKIGAAHFDSTGQKGEQQTPVPVCPNVKSLKLIMNQEFFLSWSDRCGICDYSSQRCSEGRCVNNRQKPLVLLMESLLNHAAQSFPNLENPMVQIPDYIDSLNVAIDNLRSSTGIVEERQPSSIIEYEISFVLLFRVFSIIAF